MALIVKLTFPGQTDVLGPCLPMLELLNLPLHTMAFWHVLPVPSCIAVCLSGCVLAWDGFET